MCPPCSVRLTLPLALLLAPVGKLSPEAMISSCSMAASGLVPGDAGHADTPHTVQPRQSPRQLTGICWHASPSSPRHLRQSMAGQPRAALPAAQQLQPCSQSAHASWMRLTCKHRAAYGLEVTGSRKLACSPSSGSRNTSCRMSSTCTRPGSQLIQPGITRYLQPS